MKKQTEKSCGTNDLAIVLFTLLTVIMAVLIGLIIAGFFATPARAECIVPEKPVLTAFHTVQARHKIQTEGDKLAGEPPAPVPVVFALQSSGKGKQSPAPDPDRTDVYYCMPEFPEFCARDGRP